MGLERKPAGEEIIDLLDRVLDKGIFVDASSRLHLAAARLSAGRAHIIVSSDNSYRPKPRRKRLASRRLNQSVAHGSSA